MGLAAAVAGETNQCAVVIAELDELYIGHPAQQILYRAEFGRWKRVAQQNAGQAIFDG